MICNMNWPNPLINNWPMEDTQSWEFHVLIPRGVIFVRNRVQYLGFWSWILHGCFVVESEMLIYFCYLVCIILVTLCSLLCLSVFHIWSLSLEYILLISARILVPLVTLPIEFYGNMWPFMQYHRFQVRAYLVFFLYLFGKKNKGKISIHVTSMHCILNCGDWLVGWNEMSLGTVAFYEPSCE